MNIETALTPTLVLRAGDKAVITAHPDLYAEVDVLRRLKLGVRIQHADGKVEIRKHKDLCHLSEFNAIFRAHLEALREEYLRESEKYQQRARQERLNDYIEKRQQVPRPYVRHQSEWNAGNNRAAYGPAREDGFGHRSYVQIEWGDDHWSRGVPRFEMVNWSAIGSSSPEEAMEMGKALIAAAEECIARRAEREAQLGIVIPPTA